MAFLFSCCPALFSCCSGIPVIGRCCSYCDDHCGTPGDAAKEVVEPLVAPSSATTQVALSTAVLASPTIANALGNTSPRSGAETSVKRRSVSFMLSPPNNDSLLHHPPGSPTRSIIKRPSNDFGSAEELL